MARPVKKGLDYFPLDVDFFDDDKIKFLSIEGGKEGICVLIKLYCKIYKNGYFCDWTEDDSVMFCWEMRGMFTHEKVVEVINVCLKRGIFDKSLYEEHKILTSKGIQSRYLKALDGKRVLDIKHDYWLIGRPEGSKNTTAEIITPKNDVSEEITPVSGEETPVNGGKSTQRKEKKSKVKKKEKRKKFIPPSLADVESYFDDNGYTQDAAQRAYKFYSEGDWIDSKGNPVQNWKQKMISVWFKPENKKPNSKQNEPEKKYVSNW